MTLAEVVLGHSEASLSWGSSRLPAVARPNPRSGFRRACRVERLLGDRDVGARADALLVCDKRGATVVLVVEIARDCVLEQA